MGSGIKPILMVVVEQSLPELDQTRQSRENLFHVYFGTPGAVGGLNTVNNFSQIKSVVALHAQSRGRSQFLTGLNSQSFTLDSMENARHDFLLGVWLAGRNVQNGRP
jgi:hypothetical protein